jgi:putative transposase
MYMDYRSAKLAMWYNQKRIHSTLGYKTPQAVENQIKQSA